MSQPQSHPTSPTPGQAYPPVGRPGPYGWLPEHPQGTLVLVLGLLGFFTGGVTGIIAWILGSQAQKEIRTSGVAYSNEQNIAIGKICGIVSTLLMLAGLAFVVLYLLGMLIVFGTFLTQFPR